jgi:hypothetical protein
VRLQVFTVASMKMTAFWDIGPYSLVEVDLHFRGAYCLHHEGKVTCSWLVVTVINTDEIDT